MQINRVNFSSTYQVSRQDTHLNRQQEYELKKYAMKYDNSKHDRIKGIYQFSVTADCDKKTEDFFKSLGIKVYRKFDKHNISYKTLAKYIREQIEKNKFEWIGK